MNEEVSLSELGATLQRKEPFSTVKQRWDIVRRLNGSRLGHRQQTRRPSVQRRRRSFYTLHTCNGGGARGAGQGVLEGPLSMGTKAF